DVGRAHSERPPCGGDSLCPGGGAGPPFVVAGIAPPAAPDARGDPPGGRGKGTLPLGPEGRSADRRAHLRRPAAGSLPGPGPDPACRPGRCGRRSLGGRRPVRPGGEPACALLPTAPGRPTRESAVPRRERLPVGGAAPPGRLASLAGSICRPPADDGP